MAADTTTGSMMLHRTRIEPLGRCMEANSCLKIDLDSLAHNVSSIRSLCSPEVHFCAVLKSNGYGLGAAAVAPTLIEAGASMVAVFSPWEAEPLLDLGVPVLVLMPVRTHDLSPRILMAINQEQVQFVVHDLNHAQELDEVARRLAARISIHVKIDTGLHRGGCDPCQASSLIEGVQRAPGLKLAGVMTHFADAATSDSMTSTQMQRLLQVIDSLHEELPAQTIIHAAGTCGMLRGPAFHGDMVRIGLGWTGHLTPRAEELRPRLKGSLHPAVSWTSRIALVRHVAAGEPVGYGGRWVASRPTRIGMIPVGYGDGYPHDAAHPSDGGGALCVGLGEDHDESMLAAPVIGAVNMDQIAIDLTDAPDSIQEGSSITLVSSCASSPCSLEALSKRLGRPPHALLVQIQGHIPRTYVKGRQQEPDRLSSVAAKSARILG
ncbi:MAG: alanine racemase [Phycisphaerae bacterium]|nr:alanine racemase [Phycisphaerae bacterium]